MTFAETMVARMDELGMRAVDLAEKSGVPCRAPGSNRTMWAVDGGLLVLRRRMAA